MNKKNEVFILWDVFGLNVGGLSSRLLGEYDILYDILFNC